MYEVELEKNKTRSPPCLSFASNVLASSNRNNKKITQVRVNKSCREKKIVEKSNLQLRFYVTTIDTNYPKMLLC